MSKPKDILFASALLAAISMFSAVKASAQMTIFNIPSTDTLQKHSVYVEADFIAKPTSYANGGYQTYGYRVVYGVTHKMEIGASFFYTRDGHSSVGELDFSIKHRLYLNEKRGIAASVGATLFVPLRTRTRARSIGMFYANASKVIQRVNGLRVTGGAYTIAGADSSFGTKTGAMFGVEQPLSKRISFIADWYTGKNRFGYATAGLNFAITKRQYILPGFSFGNSGRGNNAFNLYYGYTF